jgi:hypothetical protein
MAETVERAQPVVPLGLVMVRSKPPSNQPQVSLAVLSRSPMFLPDRLIDEVVLEQMSPVGSASPISVSPPFPSAMTAPPGLTVLTTPFV